MKNPPICLKDLDEPKLKRLCEKYNLTDLAYNRLKMRYIDKMKVKEIAIVESVELKTIEEHFRRIKRQIK